MFCEEPSIKLGFLFILALAVAVLASIGAFKAIRYTVTGEIIKDVREIGNPKDWEWGIILAVNGFITGSVGLLWVIGSAIKWATCP